MRKFKIDMVMMRKVAALSEKEFWKWHENLKNEEDQDELFYHRCATDLVLFYNTFFPHFCRLPESVSQRHERLSYTYGIRGSKTATAKPRGYAKTTDAFLEIIHDLCYKLERYIIVASNTEPQAIQKLKDIRAELLENARLRSLYGDFFTTKVQAATEYVVTVDGFDCKLQAVSAKKEIRGIRFREFRPTKILIDDFEHSQEVESEEIREKYENIFREVFSKIGNKETNIKVIGTVLHKRSLLQTIIKRPDYSSKVYPAILEWSERQDLWDRWKDIYTDLDDPERVKNSNEFYRKNQKAMLKGTKVLWPEHESYLDLMQELVNEGKRAFWKEKMNRPRGDEEKIFDMEAAGRFVDLGDAFRMVHNKKIYRKDDLTPFGVLDPATGQTKAKVGKKGDFSCILTGYEHHLGRMFVAHDYTKRTAPSAYIREIFQLYEEFGYNKFGVEENLYRELLIKNIKDEQKRFRRGKKHWQDLTIYEIYQTEKKERRIYTIEPKVAHKHIVFSTTLSPEFYAQMEEFPKADHDDCPDALEMLWSLRNNYYPIAGGSMPRMHRDY